MLNNPADMVNMGTVFAMNPWSVAVVSVHYRSDWRKSSRDYFDAVEKGVYEAAETGVLGGYPDGYWCNSSMMDLFTS
jgi:hypothetical protein